MKKGLLSSIAFALAVFLGEVPPVEAAQSLKMSGVVHIENYGDLPFEDSRWIGTKGQSLRLEGYAIKFSPSISGLGLQYMCHLEDLGDQPWVSDGVFCGTRGQSRRLEGLAIKLTGPEASKYDIYYACHLQDIGDTNFVLDGGFCGTRGQSRRLEALYVCVLPKGSAPPTLPPSISAFTAAPDNGYITVGGTATLNWQTALCGSGCVVSLTGHEGLGNLVLNIPKVAASGTLQVKPHFDTTYTVRAVNSAGSATKDKEVTLYGAQPSSGMVFYFKMTNIGSTVTPCFTIAVSAPNQATAKQIAEQTNGGYTATPIDASQFSTACN